ncbi:chloroperoxidase-like protein [Rhypophila decipiens]|uniref:Chloroperoxidase-like protein n=1 Tax=Rhypophila decipiens TaxID=261697 RepID=A0AAN6YBR2_9PEZI|nr:chloroperoxidase-like protein [Rhypophila decipiens]
MHLKAALSIAALSSGVVNAFPGASDHHHQKPGPGDYRSPCPMLNTLANHNYIPRSGRNISIDQIVNGIDEALNLEPAGIRPVAELASTTSTTGIPGTMNLNDLAKHGVIEHDGSLSRQDVSLGDNLNFDPKIFAPVAEILFANETISIATAAQARGARLLAAAAANPQFNFTAREDGFSLLEAALILSVFGDRVEGNAKSKWVDIFFREERLPYKEGFRRPAETILAADIRSLSARVGQAA